MNGSFAGATRPLRLLHLEDDALDAELIHDRIRQEEPHAQIRLVNSAEAYTSALERDQVDLVLSDYSLPGIDGLRALQILRERDDWTPFILVSGAVGEDRAIAMLRAGATDYILKDRMERLGPAIGRALREREERHQRYLAEERLRLAVAASDAAIYDWDMTTDTVYRAERFAQFLGIPVEKMEPTVAWWRERIHPDDRERIAAQQSLSADRLHYESEYRVRRADDTYIYLWDRSILLTDPQGRPTRLVGCALDVTERVEAERILRERQGQIVDLNRRLQIAIAESHHRIKNNLQVLVALVETTRLPGRGAAPPPEMERIARHIRALATLHDLLTQEARLPEADLETLPARPVLERLVAVLETAAGARPIRMECDAIRLSLKQCSALSLVINELVSNAIKHGAGQVRVSLTRESETQLLLQIGDDGPGLPEGFDPLHNAHTGMELVESIGRWDLSGTINYENPPEGGARISVRFPFFPLAKATLPPSIS